MDITQQYFTCKKCGVSKIWGEFEKGKDSPLGIRVSRCRSCAKKKGSQYRSRYRYKCFLAEKDWSKRNPDSAIKKHRKMRKDCAKGYINQVLRSKGFTSEQIEQNPELINIQRIIIQTKRLCKT